MTEAGLHAKVAVPRAETLAMAAGLELKDIYAHRVPIGLGLMALDGGDTTLDLGRRINAEHEEKKVRSAKYSTVLAGAVAAIVLVALVATCYLLDVAGAKKLDALVGQAEFEQARQRQVLLKTIVRHRPDMLGLLTDINAGENNGVILDGFHFKKGQSVSVDGQAGNPEQMWKFQTNLLDQKHITDVEISSQSQDPKTKKIKFTMVFHYKGFTKKGAAL